MDLNYTETEKSQVADSWLIAVLIALVIAYGWMASVALEPSLHLPNGAVSYLGWIEDSVLKDWREIQRPRSLAFAQITHELRKIENEIVLLGGFNEAPSLLIVIDDPNRYVVSDTRIEISESIAMAEGQLRKAFIKSWLLQNQPKDAIAAESLLRLEVVSDVLAAMVSSEDRLGNTADVGFIEFPSPKSWIQFAGSLDSLCGSAWTSLDLQGRCGNSKAVHPLSFRPLLTGMIWSVYKEMPPLRRFVLLRAWVEELKRSRGDEVQSEARPTELAGWRNWLVNEFRKTFPIELIAARSEFSEREKEKLKIAAAHVENMADLTESERIEVKFVFNSDQPVLKSANLPNGSFQKVPSYIVADKSNGARLFPGDVALEKSDLKFFSTPLLVWESCVEPRLGELLDNPIESKRFLIVRSCDESDRVGSWAKLARRGLSGFAKARPTAQFIQLNRDHLELAIRYGVLSKNSTFSRMRKEVRASQILGLDKPTWRGDVGAFQVLGAIEAIEWYRMSGG